MGFGQRNRHLTVYAHVHTTTHTNIHTHTLTQVRGQRLETLCIGVGILFNWMSVTLPMLIAVLSICRWITSPSHPSFAPLFSCALTPPKYYIFSTVNALPVYNPFAHSSPSYTNCFLTTSPLHSELKKLLSTLTACRFIAIKHPTGYRRIVTLRFVIVCSTLLWWVTHTGEKPLFVVPST